MMPSLKTHLADVVRRKLLAHSLPADRSTFLRFGNRHCMFRGDCPIHMCTPLRFIATFGIIAFVAGCTTVTDFVTSNFPDGETGRPSIIVRLGEQRAYLYKGGKQVAVSRVSTGRKGYRTPRGNFKVIRKDRDHRSSIYGDYVDDYGFVVKANVDSRKQRRPPGSRFEGAPMPYYIEFSPSYGFHGGHLPGYPASHGCVRMPFWKARQFYHAVKIGTPVIIKS